MDGLAAIFIVPAVLFMTIVAPIWLVMHYRHKQRTAGSLSATEREDLEDLTVAAQTMRERIEVLESILDADSSAWRERAER